MTTDYGAKVSQAGFDVKTCDKENLVFSSGYNTLKVFASGSGSIAVAKATLPAGTPGKSLVTVAHNLGYKPLPICFATSPLASNTRFSPYAYASAGYFHNVPNYAVDTTNLYLTFYNGDPLNIRTVYYRYHIYYNELS